MTEIIKLAPDDANAYAYRAYFYLLKGDFAKSVADYSECIRRKPQLFAAYVNRGFAYGEKGELDKAIADAAEAIRHLPAAGPPYCNRSFAYAEKGELAKAVADAAEAVRLAPTDAEAYFNRGYALEKKGDRKAATTAYATAIRLESAQGHEANVNFLNRYAALRADEYVAMSDFIQLPAYVELGIADIRKKLGISPQQEKKLREIAAESAAQCDKAAHEVAEQVAQLPPDRRAAEATKRMRQNWDAAGKVMRKQIEETLTARQLDAYKNRRLRELASGVLRNPDACKTLGFTPQQREQLRQLNAEFFRQWEEGRRRETERLLAMLAAPQREKLSRRGRGAVSPIPWAAEEVAADTNYRSTPRATPCSMWR